MIELGYKYCELDKIHYYSVIDSKESHGLYFNQWLWHCIKFKQTKNINLIPYHSDNSVILARYKGMNARSTAKYISKRIEKHRKSLIRKKSKN